MKALRADGGEFVAWRAAAERAGVSFNAWARRSLNEQAALDAVERREADQDLAGKFKPDPRG